MLYPLSYGGEDSILHYTNSVILTSIFPFSHFYRAPDFCGFAPMKCSAYFIGVKPIPVGGLMQYNGLCVYMDKKITLSELSQKSVSKGLRRASFEK
jgi:hypothetical protein